MRCQFAAPLAHWLSLIGNQEDQYRHCKPILLLGAADRLFDKAGLASRPPAGGEDPGVLRFAPREADAALESFMVAIAHHRFFERETDPPRV